MIDIGGEDRRTAQLSVAGAVIGGLSGGMPGVAAGSVIGAVIGEYNSKKGAQREVISYIIGVAIFLLFLFFLWLGCQDSAGTFCTFLFG